MYIYMYVLLRSAKKTVDGAENMYYTEFLNEIRFSKYFNFLDIEKFLIYNIYIRRYKKKVLHLGKRFFYYSFF